MLSRIARWRRIAVAVPIIAACAVTGPNIAQAEPGGSYVESVEHVNDRQVVVNVHSAAMNQTFPIEVVLAADRSQPRPLLYLLNGAGGGVDGATWARNTDYVDFFRDKNVNVAVPIGGRFSYYTDWIRDDPRVGRNKWATFLGKELPPLLDKELNTNGERALAAISSSATSIFNLAIDNPGQYKSIAAYSGCVQSSDPLGQNAIKLTIETWGGGGSVENMWGPLDGPGWREHDPVVNAEKLRGTQIYMSTGSGIPGINDTPANPRVADGRINLPSLIAVGAPIEAATNFCTANMANRLRELAIPAVVDFRPTGTHSWAYWEEDLHKSWPFIAGSLGL